MIAAARTGKSVVSDIAPEVAWLSVDDATGDAIDVTKITDEVDDEVDELDDEVDELNWDDVIEEMAVELATTRVREEGKLSTIAT